MPALDFVKFDATPLQKEPCNYMVIPEFIKPEILKGINADFPEITEPGNFPLDGIKYGPRFKATAF
jgi:SM-20-related protein